METVPTSIAPGCEGRWLGAHIVGALADVFAVYAAWVMHPAGPEMALAAAAAFYLMASAALAELRLCIQSRWLSLLSPGLAAALAAPLLPLAVASIQVGDPLPMVAMNELLRWAVNGVALIEELVNAYKAEAGRQ